MTSAAEWERVDALPRRRLATLPTPLDEATQLSKVVGGPSLWLKRDDLIGFGFGGNKVRSLELLLADAEARGCDVLVTGAGAQSNHVRATAAAAAIAKKQMVAVLWGTPPTEENGNLRLTRLLGSEVRYTGSVDRATVDRGIDQVTDELKAAGRNPYPIPRGGACAVGALAHALAARELAMQWERVGGGPLRVVSAAGSGGTFAGWLLGNAWLGRPFELDFVTVSRPAVELRARVFALARDACELLRVPCPVSEAEVRLHGGFIGPGYGVPTAAGSSAIGLAARTEGVFFDPTYTGKALAWYVANAASLPASPVIFLHSGGEPALFAGKGEWVAEAAAP